GLCSPASIGSLPNLKFKYSRRRTIGECDFVFIEHLPEGIELDLDHHRRGAWIQMRKPREHKNSIADLELLHHGRRRPCGRVPQLERVPPLIFDAFLACV